MTTKKAPKHTTNKSSGKLKQPQGDFIAPDGSPLNVIIPYHLAVLQKDVDRFLEESIELRFIRNDLMFLMSIYAQSDFAEKNEFIDAFNTVHKIYKLMENFEKYTKERAAHDLDYYEN